MRILILGGTGAIGKVLISCLCEKNHEIYVTSRYARKSDKKNVHYIKGNAHDNIFLNEILKEKWDSIVDFMVYEVVELEARVEKLLSSTSQYFFLSSCRVYADSGEILNEKSPRLWDVSSDKEFLNTEEYSLIKAREEDILLKSKYNNYTIIRPYITYNDNRLQLGVFEKEWWLYRALSGKKILFSKDIADCYTTLTYGYDVARVMCYLIESKAGKGEIVQIVSNQSIKWEDVLKIYVEVLEKELGIHPDLVMIDDMFKRLPGVTKYNQYQIMYDRAINRVFDSSKANRLCECFIEYTDVKRGLEKCLIEFLRGERKFDAIQWKMEAYMDIICKDATKLKDIPKWKDRFKYFIWRYTPYLKWIEKGIY